MEKLQMSRSVLRSPKSSDSSSRYLHRPASLPSWSSRARRPGRRARVRAARARGEGAMLRWARERAGARESAAVRGGGCWGRRREPGAREWRARERRGRARRARTGGDCGGLGLEPLEDHDEHVPASAHERDAEEPANPRDAARDRQPAAALGRRGERDRLPARALGPVPEAAHLAVDGRGRRRQLGGPERVAARGGLDDGRARGAALDDRDDGLLRGGRGAWARGAAQSRERRRVM